MLKRMENYKIRIGNTKISKKTNIESAVTFQCLFGDDGDDYPKLSEIRLVQGRFSESLLLVVAK